MVFNGIFHIFILLVSLSRVFQFIRAIFRLVDQALDFVKVPFDCFFILSALLFDFLSCFKIYWQSLAQANDSIVFLVDLVLSNEHKGQV